MQDDKAFETMADPRHSGVVVDLVGEVLQRRGRVCLTVSSSSMVPRLQVGDRAEVERIEGDGPRIGELLLFRDPVLGHVIHRLLWRRPLRGVLRVAYTKGDAAPYRDRQVTADRVLGRVVRVVRDGGLVVERPVERRLRWVRSVAGMVAHGIVRGRASRAATRADLGEPAAGAEIEGGMAGDDVASTRGVPRRRL